MTTLHLSCCRVDLERRIVRRKEGTLRLTSTEAALLSYLADRAGQAVPRGELLQEVWGYAEGVASRSVDTAVRRLRAKIEIDKHHPAHLLSEHGVGYRFVIFGPDASQVSAPPAARSVEETIPPPRWRPRALPGELGRLIGRGRDLASLRDHVGSGVRLVTVTGPPGVGKTRLALRLALEERDRSDADATFVDLTHARDVGDVVASIARALRYDLSSAKDPAELLGKWLAAAPPALLVLDNLEQLPAPAIALIGDLLRAAPRLRVLATSRAPTGLRGEALVPLEPLSPSDGAQLLFDRAKAAGCPASLRGTPKERERLSALLDGLPLAIELAAPRLRLFGVKGLQERLEGDGGLVESAGPVGSGVRRALDWTLALLTPEDRRALGVLSCFAGAFTAVDADALLGPRAGRHLDTLVSHSLLRPADVSAEGLPRFTMYRSVRDLASTMLRDGGGREQIERQHASLLLDRLVPLARDWEKQGGESRLAALTESIEDVQAAIARSRAWDPPDPSVARRGALALYRALRDGGEHARALEVVRAGQTGDGDPGERCLLTLFEAESLLAGDVAEREAALERATTLESETGDPWLRGRVALVRAWANALTGSGEADLLEEADSVLQRAGDHRGRALVLDVLAHRRRFAGDLEESVALRRQAARLHEEQGSRRSLALSLEHLASTLGDLGRNEEGLAEIVRAIAISSAAGNLHDAAVQRYARCSLLVGLGRIDEAKAELPEVIAALDGIGDARFAARARHGLGCVHLVAGELHDAEEAFRSALRCFGTDARNSCSTDAWLAITHYRRGRIRRGDDGLARAEAAFSRYWAAPVGHTTIALGRAYGAVARHGSAPSPESAEAARAAITAAARGDVADDGFVPEGRRLLAAWAADVGL